MPEYLSFCDKVRNGFSCGEFGSFLTAVNNMEGKLNRLYLLTMCDRGYIWGIVKQAHPHKITDIPWKQLPNDKGYSYRSWAMLPFNYSELCQLFPSLQKLSEEQ